MSPSNGPTFQRTRLACCLSVVTSAVAVFGSKEANANSFAGAFKSVCGIVSELAGNPALLAEHPDVLSQFFELALAVLQNGPAALVRSGALGDTLALAALTARHVPERQTISAVLGYLEGVSSINLQSEEAKAAINGALHQQGERVFAALLAGIGGNLGREVLNTNKVASAFSCLLGKCGDMGRVWVASALDHADFPARQLTAEDKERTLNAIWLTRENKGRFRALVTDFTKVCSGQESSSCLLDYAYRL